MLEYVRAKNIKQGDILARALHDERGMMLMAAGTKITEKAIEALKAQGFKGIYVEHVSRRENIEIPEPLVDDMDALHMISLLKKLFTNKNIFDNPYDAEFQKVLKEFQDFVDETSLSFMRLNAENKLLFELEDSRNIKNWISAHSCYTCLISIGIAIRMGLGLKFMAECGMAALLHDLGKLKYPQLLAKERISDEERELLREHPRIMFEVLQKLNMPVDTIYGVWQHHEHIDGSGYPQGLPQEKINLSAQIVGLASAYDNLIAATPYNRDPMLQGEALEYLMGSPAFSTDAVRALTEIVAPYPIGEWVELSDGTKGLVTRNHVGLPLRPDMSVYGMKVSLSGNEKYRNVTIVGIAE